MKSLYYPEFGQLTIENRPVPQIGYGEVLIEVKACGICGSELETFASRSIRRQPPLIMGHEFSGIVAEKGNSEIEIEVGSRVVSNSIVSCGECFSCRRGETNLCLNRQVFGMHRGGAFAEYVNVPAHCLIPMAADVGFEAACLTEPLANGVHMTELTREVAVKKMLVLGAGPIGLMAQQAFQAMRNAEVMVSDIKDDRLATAGNLGAVRTVNSLRENLEDAVAKFTGNEGLDLVVDAVGMEMTGRMGLKLLRPGGALVLIGLHEDGKAFQNYDIILPERRIYGSYAATQEDMKKALDLITQGKVDVTSWVDYFSLDEGVEAFTGLLRKDNKRIKTVIVP